MKTQMDVFYVNRLFRSGETMNFWVRFWPNNRASFDHKTLFSTLFQPEKPNCLKTELRNHLEIHICDMCSVFFGVNHAKGDLSIHFILFISNIGHIICFKYYVSYNMSRYMTPIGVECPPRWVFLSSITYKII